MNTARFTLLFLLATLAAFGRADDKWDVRDDGRAPRVETSAVIASRSITSGGCTVAVLPAPGSANLTFTCPETAWRMNVRNTNKGLQVQRAEFRRKPGDPFMRILATANIAEIFVPYHDGLWQHRLYDLQFCTSIVCTQEVTAQDIAGAAAELITMGGWTKPTAAVEIRDRGVAWMCKGANFSLSRRGQSMVVWSTWDTGNYDYIIEYTFRDDGQIGFRLGATGFDNPDPNFGPGLAHMHDILWRVDIDLNGLGSDSVLLETHNETTSSLGAIDTAVPFHNNTEGAATLDPLKFETVVIEDAAVNQRGHRFAYELAPFRLGASRHAELWCRDDVWITRYRASEPAVPATWTPPDLYLLGTTTNSAGIYNNESILGQDVVLWHTSPIHHEPHDEDQSPTDSGSHYSGLTLTHWTGFDLVPHNLFDFNPLGAPDSSVCP
jgi:Cu2+-containing amine oxidase